MFLASFFYITDVNQSATINFQSENVTVNNQQGSFQMQPIILSSLLNITAIISIALAVCVTIALKVFGSGISGSVIPIIFVNIILTGVFILLSSLAFPVFNTIPIFGLPIYFLLIIMYVTGMATVVVSSGGD